MSCLHHCCTKALKSLSRAPVMRNISANFNQRFAVLLRGFVSAAPSEKRARVKLETAKERLDLYSSSRWGSSRICFPAHLSSGNRFITWDLWETLPPLVCGLPSIMIFHCYLTWASSLIASQIKRRNASFVVRNAAGKVDWTWTFFCHRQKLFIFESLRYVYQFTVYAVRFLFRSRRRVSISSATRRR